MSEVDRPSASQDAVRAQQIADQKRQKQTEKAGQYGAQQQKGVGYEKKLQSSPFDEVLKNVADQGAQSFAPEAKFDSRLKEVQHEGERSSGSEDKDDGKDTKKKPEGTREGKETSAQGVKDKVLAKHGSEGGQGQGTGSGGGDSREGKSGQGFEQKAASQRFQDLGPKKADLAPAPAPMPRVELQVAAQIEAAQAPRELPKAVLDQIVQYVRIGVNKELNKEIQIDFHDQVFNGLKLKVVSHGKEVSVEFTVPNRAVLDCFKGEREKIALALGDKGIDVRSINVRMS